MGKHYDNYDYEEAYGIDFRKDISKRARKTFERDNPLKMDGYEDQWKQQQERLEEYEIERCLKEGKTEGLYRTTTTRIRNRRSGAEMLEVQTYPSFSHREQMPRTKKGRETRPSQKNLNDKNARRHFTRLVNINFGDGDIYATFGWDDVPSIDQCKKDIRNYFARLKRRYTKAGHELRYVYVLAYDGYTRVHIHIIMSGGVDRDTIEECWTKCTRKNTRRLKTDDAILTGIAYYLARNPHGGKRWSASRNLDRVPEPSRSYRKFSRRRVLEMVKDRAVLEEQMEKAYPGFKVQDAEIMYNGISAAFYIYARLVRA